LSGSCYEECVGLRQRRWNNSKITYLRSSQNEILMVKINKYEMRDGYQKKGQGTGDRLVTTENIPLRLVTLRSNVKPGVVRNVAVNK